MNLEHQPACCRMPLPHKELQHEILPHRMRVMFFDPGPLYARLAQLPETNPFSGNPFKRINSLEIGTLFPANDQKVCGCGGCGQRVTGRRSRWATEDCQKFALGVYWILCGAHQMAHNYLYQYYGMACMGCGLMHCETQIDHIIPVWAGGGCCWLSNLQILCIECHKEKTKNDRKIY